MNLNHALGLPVALCVDADVGDVVEPLSRDVQNFSSLKQHLGYQRLSKEGEINTGTFIGNIVEQPSRVLQRYRCIQRVNTNGQLRSLVVTHGHSPRKHVLVWKGNVFEST